MFQRQIAEAEIRQVLMTGEQIESYPDDRPYPSYLMLGFVGNRPVHVVAADAKDEAATIIISAYEPDPARWDATFRKRVNP